MGSESPKNSARSLASTVTTSRTARTCSGFAPTAARRFSTSRAVRVADVPRAIARLAGQRDGGGDRGGHGVPLLA